MGQHEEMPFNRLTAKQKKLVVNGMASKEILEQDIKILPDALPPLASKISMPYVIALINERIVESSAKFVRVMKKGIFLDDEQKQFISKYYRDAGWSSAKFSESQVGMFFELEA